MAEIKVLNRTMLNEYLEGVSMFSGTEVLIIGEERVLVDNNKILERWIYNIKGYATENGKPFTALKSNIILL